MLIDVLDHLLCGRSSSAAKKADAVFKIAFERRNSRFSLQLSDALRIRSLDPGPATLVDLELNNPPAKGVRVDPELRADTLTSAPPATRLNLGVHNKPHGPLLQLTRILLRHDSHPLEDKEPPSNPGRFTTKHEVTLDQAAAIMEFEGDKDAVNRLVQYAEDAPEQFAHEVQRQRDERERREEVAAEQATLIEQGYTILNEAPYYDDKDTARLSDLTTKEGADLTVEHLVGVGKDRQAHVVWGWNGLTTTVYVHNFKTYGFKKRTTTGNGPMTDDQKAERKTLIANNKAWDSAETVRREWLTAFLTRKTLPKDANQFVAVALTTHRTTVAAGLSKGNRLATTLLQLDAQDSEWGASPIDPIAATQPARSGHVAVAVVLGAIEDSTGRHTWRNPGRDAVAYFQQIAAWGYPLSDVEQIVIGATAPTDAQQPGDPDDVESDGDDGDTAA